jgi:hypothetical protein
MQYFLSQVFFISEAIQKASMKDLDYSFYRFKNHSTLDFRAVFVVRL